MMLKTESRDTTKLLDRALMWLHELEVIRLNKGLAVFRPAMTVRLPKGERRGFAKVDFEPLALHYKGQVLQVHVMAAFAQHGLACHAGRAAPGAGLLHAEGGERSSTVGCRAGTGRSAARPRPSHGGPSSRA